MSGKKIKRQADFIDVCARCTTKWSCCHETTPPVSDRRRKIIETYLKENGMQIDDPFVKAEYTYPRLDKDGYCIFHDKTTRRCVVHDVKPETCVAGPLTFDINPGTKKIEFFVKMEKICTLAGRVFEDKALLKRHVVYARKEISRLIKELDSDAVIAILKKDEPETFKIQEDSA